MNILGTDEDFSPDFVICPKCHCYSDRVVAVGSRTMITVMGYYTVCSGCGQASFLNVLGGPPLFDTSRKLHGFS